jgi:hypothetical protein
MGYLRASQCLTRADNERGQTLPVREYALDSSDHGATQSDTKMSLCVVARDKHLCYVQVAEHYACLIHVVHVLS